MRNLSNEGFTLLELLIAVLVMAMVLAVSYPSLSRASTSLHLRATARDILNTFRHAKEKAVTQQLGMKVIVDRERQEITISDSLGEGSRKYALPDDVRIERVALGGREMREGLTVIRFLPNGSSDRAEITIRSHTGSSVRIVSDPIMGGGRIESSSGER